MQSPTLEGLKEVARWLVFFVISWIITETLKQIQAVPEYWQLNIWVFSYSIPAQMLLSFSLTSAGRWLDKALFVNSKQQLDSKILMTEDKPKGLLPF